MNKAYKQLNDHIEELSARVAGFEDDLQSLKSAMLCQNEVNKAQTARINKLESDAKLSSDTAKFCFNWDFERLQNLERRLMTLEAPVQTDAPSKVIVSEQPQCTRDHVCGTGDPCNGYARTESWAKFYVLLTDAEKDRWENSDLTAEAIYNQRPKTQSSTTYGSTSTAQFQSRPDCSCIRCKQEDGRV